MAKYCGKIGYVVEEETAPGVWDKVIKERTYYGDIINIKRTIESSNNTDNDTIMINSKLSIISDPFAKQNINTLRYAVINGVKWTIKRIDFAYPRMIIELGGIYNDIGRKED